jgi:hypothetical protein
MASLRDTALPAAGNQNWYAHYQAMDEAARRGEYDAFHLDEFTGTDDQKLTAAIAAQQADTARNMPPIILPSRPISFTTPRQMYSGMKIIGAHKTGQKNPELSSGQLGGAEITFGGSVGNGASSWLNNAASTSQLFNIHVADISLQGSQGAATHQFVDCTAGTLYACNFDAVSGNFMRAMYGDHAGGRKCLVTQVSWTGNNTWNNAWKCQMFIGGSDVLVSPDMMNIGVSQSAAQTGTLATYFIVLDSLEADLAGKVYVSTMNGWRGLLISGTSNINMVGGVYEGFKPTRVNGLLGGPGPGSQIKVTGGVVSMFGTKIGQGMDNPDATENGLLDISGGEVNLFGVEFYGRNLGTPASPAVKAITHTGGRLMALGVTRRPGETGYWTGRPQIETTATPGTGTYTYCNPDQSVV